MKRKNVILMAAMLLFSTNTTRIWADGDDGGIDILPFGFNANGDENGGGLVRQRCTAHMCWKAPHRFSSPACCRALTSCVSCAVSTCSIQRLSYENRTDLLDGWQIQDLK